MIKGKDNKSLKNQMQPESLAMSYGYSPEWSEGAVKCPIFQTSTFVFPSAEHGKKFFEVAIGKSKADPSQSMGLIYSRLNNPDLEILEDRLTLWEKAEAAAVFESGMAAISTSLMAIVKPGDVVLHSEPLYGGTDHFIKHILKKFGVDCHGILPGESKTEILAGLKRKNLLDRVSVIFVETPANPTNQLFDLQMLVELAKDYRTSERPLPVVVDNTFLGPVFQKPIQLGVDLSLYSATKYLGGHSDVVAGAAIGGATLIQEIKKMRTYLGSMAGPWTGWLLMRSLETLKIRMQRQCQTAEVIAKRLQEHPKVAKVFYPGLLEKGTQQYDIYQRHCSGPGAMISFDVHGGESEAFRVLNSFKLVKLAVSLGSTESLAEHPKSMTHASVDDDIKNLLGISDQLIRLSVGVEDPDDLWWDLNQALNSI